MKALPLPRAHGHVIFCEDIRQEMTHKEIFIGVYAGSVMNVHVSFPYVMPRLCLAISYFELMEVRSEEVSFLVFLPGDVPDSPSMMQNIKIPPDLGLNTPSIQKFGDEIPTQILTIEPRLFMQNLLIKEPGLIRVRAENTEGRIRLGSLNVIHVPPVE